MSKKIYPGIAARLEFIVEDADGLPVPSLAHGDVSSSAYRNITNGVQSSATTATVTSSVASTAAVSAGQFVTIDSARGHYAIDVASGAAGSTLDYAEAVVAFTAGHTVTPIQHEIDETLYEVNIVKAGVVVVDSNVSTILGRVTSTVATMWAALVEMISGTAPDRQFTAKALELAPAGGGTESALMVSTTIATLASQTSFTLTAGSADNDAYNRQLGVITDSVTSAQKARVIIDDYVGSTKTVTLLAAPAFTIAAGDSISIMAIGSDVSNASIASVIGSVIVSAGVTTTVTGMPTFLRVGDARTVANGGAIPVRLYDVDDDSLLFGLGTSLFADATITFSLRRAGTDSEEGVEDAAIPCTWVEDGADGYVQIAYDADALDDCDAMDKLKEKDCHRWGIKFQWGTDDPITPVYGTISVLRKIVTTQS